MSCEKCWNDAGIMAASGLGLKHEIYHELLKERQDKPCSPKEQAGEWWDEERQCDKRYFEEAK